MEADNHSDISSISADGSSATGCSIALSMENGSLNAAANRRACSPQRRTKAAVNAPERPALDCAIPNLHPRKVAQRVVRVGPPRRCTILDRDAATGYIFPQIGTLRAAQDLGAATRVSFVAIRSLLTLASE